MKLYADLPAARVRQAVTDGAVLVWTIAWVVIGRTLYRLIDELRSAGESVEQAGARFAGTLDDVAGNVGRVPIAGPSLRRPFSGAAGAGRSLADAGATGSEAVHDIALLAGVLVAVLPIAWLLAKWLPGRVRWAREAVAAPLVDPEILAARAVAHRPLHELARTPCDTTSLAALELRAMGLRAP